MILRIVRGVVPASELASVAEGFTTRYVPRAAATPGLVRFHAGIRPGEDRVDIALVTFWTSVDAALAAFDGDLDTPRTLDELSAHATFTEVVHFEVDESQLRNWPSDAAVLRIGIGRVAQGIDVSIQQDLRSRLGELPDEMAEAYVARRIVGSEVEVAFISTWERVPPGLTLDAPIWPDVVARSDAFTLESFVPIVSGSAGGSG